MAISLLPEIGYELLRVFVTEQSYRLRNPAELEEDADGERILRFRWDWFVVNSEEFMVSLGVHVGPTPESPDEASAQIVGAFLLDDYPRSLSIEDFVMAEAPKLLFSHLVGTVSSLTSYGPSGAYILPLTDIGAVVSGDYLYSESTGAQQLKENRELRRAYAFERANATPVKRTRKPPNKASQ